MGECHSHKTLLPTGIKLTEAMAPQTEADHQGSLMWVQVATRPDLLFAVGLLARFQANPGLAHWQALIHVLGYVKGTFKYRITYSKDFRGQGKPIGYVDVDYGGDLDTWRSTSGYVFLMAGGAVLWSSKHQNTVALSTTEAEYMAMT